MAGQFKPFVSICHLFTIQFSFNTETFFWPISIQLPGFSNQPRPGMNKGRAYNEEELLELEFGDRSFTAEELAELDSDWGSSSDKFKHDNFQVGRNWGPNQPR